MKSRRNRCSSSECFPTDQLWVKAKRRTGELPNTTSVGISIYDTVWDATRDVIYDPIHRAVYEITT